MRQQLRGPVFLIVVTISALMVAGAVWSPELRVGLSDTDAVAGADFAIRTHLVWSLFYLFTAAAFAAEAVLRDEQTGFTPIIGAAPVPRRTDLIGRCIGAYLATVFCYLSVPIALQLAAGGAVGPKLYALAVFGLPNLLTATALFLVIAALVRSLLGAMLGAVALLALYGSGTGAGAALIEPFGFAAYAEATAGWDDRAARLPSFAGPILANRLLWIAISLAALTLLITLDPRRRTAKPAARVEAEPPIGISVHIRQLPDPSSGGRAGLAQFGARTRLEVSQILFTPVFAILLLLGLGHAASILWRLGPAASRDAGLLALVEAFQLTPVVVALFFAGELYWAERDRRVHDLVAATPLPDAALFLPKLLALTLALGGLAFASALAALLVPLLTGGEVPTPGRLLIGYALPKWLDWTFVGVLALFLQALAPSKLAGWGLTVLYPIASLALERTGYHDPLYRYGEYPSHPVPEPLAGQSFSAFRFYWASIALLLILLSTRLAGRAGHDPLRIRIRRLL